MIKKIDTTLIRFLFVGASNTLIGLAVIYMAKWMFGIGDVLANALGYSIGITISFLLNKNWTFRHKGTMLPAFFRFLGVIAIAYIANLLLVLICIKIILIDSYYAHALGVIPYTTITFLGSRYFAFHPSSNNVANYNRL